MALCLLNKSSFHASPTCQITRLLKITLKTLGCCVKELQLPKKYSNNFNILSESPASLLISRLDVHLVSSYTGTFVQSRFELKTFPLFCFCQNLKLLIRIIVAVKANLHEKNTFSNLQCNICIVS